MRARGLYAALGPALALLIAGCTATGANRSAVMALTATDQSLAGQTRQELLERQPSGTSRSWSSSTGAHGTITVVRTYRARDRRWCRETRETVVRGDRKDDLSAILCRNSSGVWVPSALQG